LSGLFVIYKKKKFFEFDSRAAENQRLLGPKKFVRKPSKENVEETPNPQKFVPKTSKGNVEPANKITIE
jgi:hypothetical protein